MTIITCNMIDSEHLDTVKADMQVMGAPTVRAIYDGEIYWAVEGSHRLMAAFELGITPIIDVVEYNDDVITIQQDDADEDVIVSEYADRLFRNRHNHIIQF